MLVTLPDLTHMETTEGMHQKGLVPEKISGGCPFGFINRGYAYNEYASNEVILYSLLSLSRRAMKLMAPALPLLIRYIPICGVT